MDIAATIWRRERGIVLTGVAALSALAWVTLVRCFSDLAAPGMAGANMGMAMAMPSRVAWPGEALLLAFAMWAVMMVAMMLPSAMPLLLMVRTVSARRQARPSPAATTALVGFGYLTAWAAFSLLAAGGQWELERLAMLSPAMRLIHPRLAGLLLILAGVYQFSPWKNACLSRCRTPLGFVLAEWRDGTRGAFVLGLRHGLYCVGCCWLLMALLFVVGVMNLVWVTVIAAAVLVEKVWSRGVWVSRGMGVLLLGWGLWIAASLATMYR